MKTLNLKDQSYTFEQALKKLLDGECIGIRPGNNCNYLRLAYHLASGPHLAWSSSDENYRVRAAQYQEEFTLVVVDHRELKL